VLGGKTGFNNAARYCLVFAARVGGRRLGMAFLGTEGERTRFGDVARVSDWVVARRSRAVATPAASAVPTPEVVPDPAEDPTDPEGAAPAEPAELLPPTASAGQPD
jgi:D-alanyl-D-alanine carboxypeptidase